MAQAVQCPRCGGWSRVEPSEVGATVACPHCAKPFPARLPPPAVAPIPVVHRRLTPPEPHHAGPVAVLVGFSLVPLGVPFVWLLLPLLTGVRPIFTFALPTAIALGVTGLCLGVTFTSNWSVATRLRAIVMLLLLGAGSAAFLYFVKKEWAEAVRKRVPGPPEFDWRDFSPPDGAYQARLPGRPVAAGESPLPGWPLTAYKLASGPKNDPVLSLAYELAHGPAADAVRPRRTPDDEWFAAARAALVQQTGGQVTGEKAGAQQSYPARDFTLTLPDGATTRLVRVVRGDRRAFYLAVEGAFIARDHRFVKTFFDKFRVTP